MSGGATRRSPAVVHTHTRTAPPHSAGAGKTYTMFGPDLDVAAATAQDASRLGLIPRALHELFERIGARAESGAAVPTVHVSYFQLYLNDVYDLLGTFASGGGAHGTPPPALAMREGPHGAELPELTMHQCDSVHTVLALLQWGAAYKQVAATALNARSSRAHTFFTVQVQYPAAVPGSAASLTFVDLAGSERVSRTGATGRTLTEAKHINKSLSALGNVVSALASAASMSATHIDLSARDEPGSAAGPALEDASFVPWRDSKLTRLLQPYMGTRCSLTIALSLAPGQDMVGETMASVLFAARARGLLDEPVEFAIMPGSALWPESPSSAAARHSGQLSASDWGGTGSIASPQHPVALVALSRSHAGSVRAGASAQTAAMQRALDAARDEARQASAQARQLEQANEELQEQLTASQEAEFEAQAAVIELQSTLRKTEAQLHATAQELAKLKAGQQPARPSGRAPAPQLQPAQTPRTPVLRQENQHLHAQVQALQAQLTALLDSIEQPAEAGQPAGPNGFIAVDNVLHAATQRAAQVELDSAHAQRAPAVAAATPAPSSPQQHPDSPPLTSRSEQPAGANAAAALGRWLLSMAEADQPGSAHPLGFTGWQTPQRASAMQTPTAAPPPQPSSTVPWSVASIAPQPTEHAAHPTLQEPPAPAPAPIEPAAPAPEPQPAAESSADFSYMASTPAIAWRMQLSDQLSATPAKPAAGPRMQRLMAAARAALQASSAKQGAAHAPAPATSQVSVPPGAGAQAEARPQPGPRPPTQPRPPSVQSRASSVSSTRPRARTPTIPMTDADRAEPVEDIAPARPQDTRQFQTNPLLMAAAASHSAEDIASAITQ